jgi:hypothetical protein
MAFFVFFEAMQGVLFIATFRVNREGILFTLDYRKYHFKREVYWGTFE